VIQAVAPIATAEVFELLLRYPLTADDYQPRQAVFAALGQSLLREPEAIDVLLTAYTQPRDPGPDANYGAARFAREVFAHAGPAILPNLHQALASRDRVIRSNAACGCGSIGDPSSIEPLIDALDLESGLSRASIVWALGELKARQALPRLAKLYRDACNDEQRNRGAGFRIAQAAAQATAQYDAIGRLSDIESDWSELKQLAEPAAIDPRRNEPLLSTEIVLAAVRKIGPEFSQDFYRQLAAEQDPNARREAAERLAEAAVRDRDENLPILRSLLADSAIHVRMAAAVSLLILDQTGVQSQILTWLKSSELWQRNQIVWQLERVSDGKRLMFARTAVAETAGDDSIESTLRQRFKRLLLRIPAH
jgi:HEAT repeat protein